MFTGLVTDIGTILKAEHSDALSRFRVHSHYPVEELELGASILHSGVCLTLVDFAPEGAGSAWTVEAVPETVQKTVLGQWKTGKRVNLEQSLKLGDKLGGHFVFGHVDGLGEIIDVRPEGDSHRITLRPPADIARYFASKGSVTIDGVSLTVADALPNGDFQIAIIPHSWEVTTLSGLKPGDYVNLEIDMLARYVARLIGQDMTEDIGHG